LKKLITILLFFTQTFWLGAQPALNQIDDFGREANITSSLIATDSCYYTLGTVYNDLIPSHLDLVFTKFDLNGVILTQKFHNNE